LVWEIRHLTPALEKERFHETKVAAVKRADKASSLGLRLTEIAIVLVRLYQVASRIVNESQHGLTGYGVSRI